MGVSIDVIANVTCLAVVRNYNSYSKFSIYSILGLSENENKQDQIYFQY